MTLGSLQPHSSDDFLQVEARHIGDMKFKGVAGTHTVMQINNARHADRKFPMLPPSGKAELVSCQTPAHLLWAL